jgi:transposase-like protein
MIGAPCCSIRTGAACLSRQKAPPQMALSTLEGAGEARPKTRLQRSQLHAAANVVNKLPTNWPEKAKRALQEIWTVESKTEAETEFVVFIESYTVTCAMAVECLKTDRVTTLVFLEIPAEHYKNF